MAEEGEEKEKKKKKKDKGTKEKSKTKKEKENKNKQKNKEPAEESKESKQTLLPDQSLNKPLSYPFSYTNPTYPAFSFGTMPIYAPIIQQDSIFDTLKKINGELEQLTNRLNAVFPVIDAPRNLTKILQPSTSNIDVQVGVTTETIGEAPKKPVAFEKPRIIETEKMGQEAQEEREPLTLERRRERENPRETPPTFGKSRGNSGSVSKFPKQSATIVYRPLKYSPYHGSRPKEEPFRTVKDFYRGRSNFDYYKGTHQEPRDYQRQTFSPYEKSRAKEEPFRTVKNAHHGHDNNKDFNNEQRSFQGYPTMPQTNFYSIPSRQYYQ